MARILGILTGARYYSSNQGRFTGCDPYDVNLDRQETAGNEDSERQFVKYISQPQHWNHYTYVLNNPLTFVDPDGWKEEENTFTALLLGEEVKVTVDKKILKQDPNALALVKEKILAAFDKINKANEKNPFSKEQLDSIHRLDNIKVNPTKGGLEGMVGDTFHIKFSHAANPNIDILSGNIMHDARHAEQRHRGLSYDSTTAIPMEMEASSFVVGVIETRGWSEYSLNYFRSDAATGHLPDGWKDRSTSKTKQKVFDAMKGTKK